jgi:hypothetical protein
MFMDVSGINEQKPKKTVQWFIDIR